MADRRFLTLRKTIMFYICIWNIFLLIGCAKTEMVSEDNTVTNENIVSTTGTIAIKTEVIETEEIDCKEPAGKPDREGKEVSVPMDELVEEGREETAGLTRQEYMNSLDIKEVSSYISHFLSEEILRCPALVEKWLKDCVNEEGQSV